LLRPKTNAYDGWSPVQYDRYIVDLALFGTNLIELIPWSTDDVLFSPMFPVDPKQLLAQVSAICDRLGISVGLWCELSMNNAWHALWVGHHQNAHTHGLGSLCPIWWLASCCHARLTSCGVVPV
jgi:hypothetical protein